jgi:D-sedoheptulose 7-phosphate isomerase
MNQQEKNFLARTQLAKGIELKEKIKSEEFLEKIVRLADEFTDCIKSGGKILLCGNGGSAADCQHIAGELVVRLNSDSQREALPAIALTVNPSVVTAAANDFGFERIFSRQVEALGRSGDYLLCITTSGNSPNLLFACEAANKKGLKTFALLGKGGGKLKDLVDFSLVVPSNDTQRIQEVHITIGHILVLLIEKNLMAGNPPSAVSR